MPIRLPIESELDERSATAAADKARRVFENAGRDASKSFSELLSQGMEDSGKAAQKAARTASDAYDRMRDSVGKLRSEEERLKKLRDDSASNDKIVAQAERVEKARRAEARAVRDAQAAYSDYQSAARDAQAAGERSGQGFLGGLRGGVAAASGAGREFAEGLSGGFLGSDVMGSIGGGLMRAGPWAAVGVTAAKIFGDSVGAGLSTLNLQSQFQAAMGIDAASMSQFAHAAGAAYANNFGESLQANLSTAQVALQGGLIQRNSSESDIRSVVEHLQGVSAVTGADPAELTRSIATLMRTGLADNVKGASDIITSGFQGGLDISKDWLDTLNEYSTQFRKLGLDASEFMTLLHQGLEGGARDTDKVADSLKEFSIRAVDGSKTTKEGFEALGFNAQELGRRFAEGGESAKTAFSAVLDALHSVQSDQEKALIWQRLFGTQWEDMGAAINNLSLAGAKAEFTDMQGASDRAMTTATDNAVSKWEQAKRGITQQITEIKTSLASLVDPAVNGFLDKLIAATKAPPPGLKDGLFVGVPGTPGVPVFPAGPVGPGVAMPALPGRPSGNPLDIITGVSVPAPGAPPARNFYKDWYQQPGAPAPGAPMPGAPVPIPLTPPDAGGTGSKALPPAPALPFSYTPTGGLPAAVADATARLDEAKHEQAEREARVNQLRQSNVATDNDITKAQNDVVEAQRKTQQAQQAVQEAWVKGSDKYASTMQRSADQLGQIGAQLDNDFGISKGLPGIAENITKFIANLAFAPALGALNAVVQASGGPGASGSGLVGVLAANGAFGPQYTTAGMLAQSQTYASALPAMPGFAAQPGESARDFAHRVMMPFWQSQGFEVGDHQADKYGEHQNGALDIMVPSIAAGNQVLAQVLSDPNVYGAIFNNKTYGYGHGLTPQDYTAGHTGDPSQDHLNHVHALYRPGGPNNINPLQGASSGPVPVAIVSAPGMPQIGGPASILAPAAPVATPSAAVPGATWPIGPGPLPNLPAGAGGEGYMGQMPGPGIGGAAGLGAGAGGMAPPSNPSGGKAGLSGAPMDALMGAASGLDMVMPGAGAAAKIGIQLANRTAEFGGQVAGIAAGGLGEFLSVGDNPRGSLGASWIGKALGGLAGARPALPNMAGQKPPQASANTNNNQRIVNNNQSLTITNNRAEKDIDEDAIVKQTRNMWAQPGRQ